jgi:single-strand DNA-binding protein
MASGKGTVNKVILIGRLGNDPELKYTATNVAVAKLSVATNRVWKDDAGNAVEKTDWHRVVAWRKLGEIAGEYLKKGSQVYIEGHLETRSWDDPNGQKHWATEVIAENLVMLGRREERGATGTGYQPPEPEAPPAASADEFSPDLGGEDDLPF